MGSSRERDTQMMMHLTTCALDRRFLLPPCTAARVEPQLLSLKRARSCSCCCRLRSLMRVCLSRQLFPSLMPSLVRLFARSLVCQRKSGDRREARTSLYCRTARYASGGTATTAKADLGFRHQRPVEGRKTGCHAGKCSGRDGKRERERSRHLRYPRAIVASCLSLPLFLPLVPSSA